MGGEVARYLGSQLSCDPWSCDIQHLIIQNNKPRVISEMYEPHSVLPEFLWPLSCGERRRWHKCCINSLVTILQRLGHFFKLSNRALMATITVLADISTAPKAGLSSTPHA